MLELDRRLELALALPRNAVRMGEKFDPTLLPSALDPLVAVFVDGQEVVPQFLIGFRHVFDRSHGGELQLELAELFLVVIVLVRLRERGRGLGSIISSLIKIITLHYYKRCAYILTLRLPRELKDLPHDFNMHRKVFRL